MIHCKKNKKTIKFLLLVKKKKYCPLLVIPLKIGLNYYNYFLLIKPMATPFNQSLPIMFAVCNFLRKIKFDIFAVLCNKL